MNIIFVLPLVLCLFDLSVIARLRENLNVLVPNNDVNLHAKIKTLLNGDEVDPEDFSDNEIESLNALKTQKIEILRSKSIIKTNKIFDDVNKNIESNQIDRDELSPNAELVRISDDLRSSQTKFSGAPTNPSNNNTEPVGSSLTPSPTLPMNSTLTSTFATLSFTGPTMPNSTHPSSPHFSTDQTPSGTTVNHTTPWPITDPSPTLPHTRNDSSTPSWDSTPITPTLTWIRPTEPQENSTRPPIIVDNFNIDECLLGKAERYLPWLTETGGLNTAFILSQFEENVRMVDASRIANNSAEFDVYTRNESFSVSFPENFSSASSFTLIEKIKSNFKRYQYPVIIAPIIHKFLPYHSPCSTLYHILSLSKCFFIGGLLVKRDNTKSKLNFLSRKKKTFFSFAIFIFVLVIIFLEKTKQ